MHSFSHKVCVDVKNDWLKAIKALSLSRHLVHNMMFEVGLFLFFQLLITTCSHLALDYTIPSLVFLDAIANEARANTCPLSLQEITPTLKKIIEAFSGLRFMWDIGVPP